MNDFRSSLAAQISDAKLSVAKSALATPFVYHEGCELHNAIRAYHKAVNNLARAREAWGILIAPAGSWAADPFTEELQKLDKIT